VLTGVATGATSGIVIIDIDPRHGGDKWLFQNWNRIPQTRIHLTPSGGWHLIFKNVPGLRQRNGFAPGVDIRAGGPHFIWYPAHAGIVLCEGPVAEFPRWVLDELKQTKNRPESKTNGGRGRPVDGMKTDPLPRDLYRLLLKLVPTARGHDQRCVRGLLSVVVHATDGTRNDKLNWAAFNMRQYIEAGIISRENAETLLMHAAADLIATDREARVWATIQSGLNAGHLSATPPNLGGDAA
jgi:hypothetical protein